MAGVRAPPKRDHGRENRADLLISPLLIANQRSSWILKVNVQKRKIGRRGSEVLSFQSAVFDFSAKPGLASPAEGL